MKLTMTLQAIDPSNDENVNRNMGNINTDYVTYTKASETPSPELPLPYVNGTQYSSFMAWVDAVARGLNSLSNNTYRNASVAATWDVMAEVEG